MTFSLSSHLHRSRRSLENFFIRPIGSIFTAQHFAAMNAAIPSTAESFLLFYYIDYYTDTPFTTATLPMMMIPIGILSVFQLIQWYFLLCFGNLYARYLSNRDNFDVFRNSNWNGHLWESFSHKWYLHKNKSESPKWVRT